MPLNPIEQPKHFVKILGASGGKSKDKHLTSLQISNNSVIDAGNLIQGLGENLNNLEHLFLTHLHLDHIVDIPFVIDSIFETQKKPLKIYARKENLSSLKKHILNWEIWPDFTSIKMKNTDQFCIELIPIELDSPFKNDDFTITAIANNHTPYSNGYIVTKEENSFLLTSDTYCCDSIWERVNNDFSIKTVIIEVSFPSHLNQLAFDSKHLTPKLLKEELSKLKREDVTIHINHLKPFYEKELYEEINANELLLNKGSILQTNDIVYY